MGLGIEPAEGAGATVSGVDLGLLDNQEFEAIRRALADYGVIFFRDQKLSEDEHIAFAGRFGPININRFFAAHPQHPQIALVAKEPDQKDNIGGGWHTDHSYDREPALGSVLVARELPKSGGDTLFASMYAAYETLDQATKKEIEGLNAVHSSKHIFGSGSDTYYNKTDAGGGRIGNTEAAEQLKDVVHPVVIRHPDSGKKALYVNPAFTVRFENMTREQSLPLLTKLYAHCFKGDFHHRFQWEPGSIAVWDNRSTWHWALNDYQGPKARDAPHHD